MSSLEKSLIKQSQRFYQNRSAINWVALIVAMVIGGGSIFYTNELVNDLAERERRYIELFANALEFSAMEENSDQLIFITQEIIGRNNSIPVILTEANGTPITSRNINLPKGVSEAEELRIYQKELKIMQEEHDPIVVSNVDQETGEVFQIQLVYYRNSDLLYRLKYYPYIQLSVISIFILLAYLFINSSRRAEQNRVWVGLAKETAHQLGTPISSLMAWVEYLKEDKGLSNKGILQDMEKDLNRLDMVTSRFSSIGSMPVLSPTDLKSALETNISYLQNRISSKVKLTTDFAEGDFILPLNKPLFDWVIENLCKNAVDATSGFGNVHISLHKGKYDDIIIDIQDDGKGIPPSKLKQVFQPGFTTKKRGWGLGLTLAKRIIETYHKGRIFVKESVVDKGTTFRIILPITN